MEGRQEGCTDSRMEEGEEAWRWVMEGEGMNTWGEREMKKSLTESWRQGPAGRQGWRGVGDAEGQKGWRGILSPQERREISPGVAKADADRTLKHPRIPNRGCPHPALTDHAQRLVIGRRKHACTPREHPLGAKPRTCCCCHHMSNHPIRGL